MNGPDDIDRARAEARLADWVGKDVKLTKDGADSYKGLCPFHNENTPSFSLFRGRDGVERYHCFGCGERGDVVDWIMATRGVDIHEACKMIYGDAEDSGNRRERTDAPPPHDPYAGVAPLPMPEDAVLPLPGQRFKVWNPKREKYTYYTPEAVYRYDCGFVLRMVFDGKKITPQIMWCEVNGKAQWSHYAFPRPRPAYGVENVTPTGQFLIVEGEKTADAARKLLTMSIVTYSGGTNALQYTDWEFTKGRDVIYIPDADKPGRDAAEKLALILDDIGAKSIRIVDTSEMEAVKEGWDLADAVEEDWDKDKIMGWVNANSRPWSPPGEPDEDRPAPAVTGVDFIRGEGGKGAILKIQGNFDIALRRLGIEVSYDRFARRLLIHGLDRAGPVMDDPALIRLMFAIDEAFCLLFNKNMMVSLVEDRARRNAFHPVLDYLNGLEWDREPRIDTWLTYYGGAKDTPYTRAIGRLMLIAAVRRVCHPGCKFDQMPIFEGEQGVNKSTSLRVLAVKDEWFTDDFPLHADGKRVIEALQGKWIVEASELAGLKKADIESLKSSLSRGSDIARLSYDRLTSEHDRQCLIVGTTNATSYLRDMTGNRRFWPVRTENFDIDALMHDRDQVWAEAVYKEASEVSLVLPEDLWAAAAEEQENRLAEDPWEEIFQSVFSHRGEVEADELWTALELPKDRRDQHHNVRLGLVMKRLGFEKKRLRRGDPVGSVGGRSLRYIYVRTSNG